MNPIWTANVNHDVGMGADSFVAGVLEDAVVVKEMHALRDDERSQLLRQLPGREDERFGLLTASRLRRAWRRSPPH